MFTLTIATDNEAFQPDPRPEMARLLRLAAVRISNGELEGTLRDENGNKVGEYANKE